MDPGVDTETFPEPVMVAEPVTALGAGRVRGTDGRTGASTGKVVSPATGTVAPVAATGMGMVAAPALVAAPAPVAALAPVAGMAATGTRTVTAPPRPSPSICAS
jgi:hypothetical protein